MSLLMGVRLRKTIVSHGCSPCPPALRQEAATWKLARIAINATNAKTIGFVGSLNDIIQNLPPVWLNRAQFYRFMSSGNSKTILTLMALT